jgi:hypothetical protein
VFSFRRLGFHLRRRAIAFGSFFEKSEKVGRVRALARTYAAKIGGALQAAEKLYFAISFEGAWL